MLQQSLETPLAPRRVHRGSHVWTEIAHHHKLTEEEQEKMETFEGLDYDTVENEYRQQVALERTAREARLIELSKWALTLAIGVSTGLTAFLIKVGVDALAELRFRTTLDLIASGSHERAFVAFAGLAVLYVLVAAVLVAYVEPVACGSGIPEMKGYLNGANFSRAVRLKTLLVKAVGVMFSVAAGLPIGKEGPMVHIGSCFAANWSHLPKIPSICKNDAFKVFRTDHYKRDFVSGGCAAGVAAAFGAPVGGILFSLEEASSFWSMELTWRSFFCAMVSTFTLNIFVSGADDGHWDNVNSPGLITFGGFQPDAYRLWELPIFALIGVTGGMLGGLFNAVNFSISKFRRSHINPYPPLRLLEASLICLLCAAVAFWLPSIYSGDCKHIPGCVLEVDGSQAQAVSQGGAAGAASDTFPDFVAYRCGPCTYNDMATLIFTTQEKGIKSLFHNDIARMFQQDDPDDPQNPEAYGMAVPSGLFVPCILIGASMGRVIGQVIIGWGWRITPGTYALIGAASMLGGVTRMTISLTVILVETTNDIQYMLPIMMVIMVSKWVGDLFNISLYDIHVELKCIPFVESSAPAHHSLLKARDFMIQPVVTLDERASVRTLMETLNSNKHHGFPVVRRGENGQSSFVGLALRSQIVVVLRRRAFLADPSRLLNLRDFSTTVSSRSETIPTDFSPQELASLINLVPIMNPAPFSVQEECPASRLYRLFRAMGLRHLVVVGPTNDVRGIVTRKDLRSDFSQDLF